MGIDSAAHLIKSPSTSRFRFDSGDTVPAGFTIATDFSSFSYDYDDAIIRRICFVVELYRRYVSLLKRDFSKGFYFSKETEVNEMKTNEKTNKFGSRFVK